jgi:peptidoglycan/xylan/chitin deacetylase (PgdA/CDA1 family)
MINLLAKIRYQIKKFVIEFLNLKKFFISDVEDSLRIMMIHDTPKKDHYIYEKQIEFLLLNGWRPLDPKKFIENKIKKKKIIGKNLVITFDDGLKSNKNLAEKLKNKFGIKSIFFIPYSFVNIKKTKDIKKFCLNKLNILKKKYYNLNLNFKDLKKLVLDGHVIGSHTINHLNLKNIVDIKQLKNEIAGSKRLLTKLTGKKINIFAFTFGTLNDIDKKSLKISLDNYDLIFSGIRGNNIKNNRILFRDEINGNYSKYMCQSLLSGNIDFLYSSERKKLLKMSQ